MSNCREFSIKYVTTHLKQTLAECNTCSHLQICASNNAFHYKPQTLFHHVLVQHLKSNYIKNLLSYINVIENYLVMTIEHSTKFYNSVDSTFREQDTRNILVLTK